MTPILSLIKSKVLNGFSLDNFISINFINDDLMVRVNLNRSRNASGGSLRFLLKS